MQADAETPGETAGDTAGESAQKATSGNPLRRFYAWTLSWADTPYAVPALFVMAFVESSFFPIPPDVLLLVLALAAPTSAFRYAAWCTVGSVLGGIFGYFIGFAVWSSVEPFMFQWVLSAEKFDYVMGIYREWGGTVVFLAAFTPIPYKVFTIAAGVASLNLPLFVAASLIGRAARFFLVAAFIYKFHDKAVALIDRWFNWITIGVAVAVVLVVVLTKLL